MICFKDMTFCNSDCINVDCRRHFGPEEEAASRGWWGLEGTPPVSFSDFSDDCPAYLPERQEKRK